MKPAELQGNVFLAIRYVFNFCRSLPSDRQIFLLPFSRVGSGSTILDYKHIRDCIRQNFLLGGGGDKWDGGIDSGGRRGRKLNWIMKLWQLNCINFNVEKSRVFVCFSFVHLKMWFFQLGNGWGGGSNLTSRPPPGQRQWVGRTVSYLHRPRRTSSAVADTAVGSNNNNNNNSRVSSPFHNQCPICLYSFAELRTQGRSARMTFLTWHPHLTIDDHFY